MQNLSHRKFCGLSWKHWTFSEKQNKTSLYKIMKVNSDLKEESPLLSPEASGRDVCVVLEGIH